jgi:drug/metabolite transporter (DMT)-like permease
MNKEYQGIFFAVLAAMASTISATLLKQIPEISISMLVFFRFFFGLLFLIPILIYQGVQIKMSYIPKHIHRVLFGLGAICCYFYSLKHIELISAVTLANTSPLFMPLAIFVMLKLLIPKSRFISLFIGFLGVLLILKPGYSTENFATFIGLMGALFSAFSIVGIRQLSRSESTLAIMGYYYFLSVILLAIPLIYNWKTNLTLGVWVNTFFMSIFFLAYQYFLSKALSLAPATKVGVVSYLSVILSGIIGWLIFNEMPQKTMVMGIIFIVAGGLMAIFSKEPPKKYNLSK